MFIFLFLFYICLIIGLLTCIQENLKKILVYSITGHLSYLFLFIYEGMTWDNLPKESIEIAIFYFLITSFLYLGFFLTVLSMKRTGNTYTVKSVYDLAQLWLIDKVVALCCLILLVGLASIPFFPGFLCKWFFVQSIFTFDAHLGILSLYTSVFTTYPFLRMMHQILLNKNLMFNDKSPRWYFDQLLTPSYKTFLIFSVFLFILVTANPSMIWYLAHKITELVFV